MTQTAADDRPDPQIGSWRAWLMFGIAALFFFYGFFQRVAPSVMVDQLMADFMATGAIIGNLSAVYYYAYAGLQIPVGVMMDRWGPRRLVTFGAFSCAGGTLLFALAPDLTLAYTGRLFVGVGAGFGFVAALALASNWFPASRFAFFTGMTMMSGMLGGFAAQAPLAAVIETTGWRDALVAAGLVGCVLTVAAWLVIRDRPKGQAVSEHAHQSFADLLRGLGEVLRLPQNWLIAVAGASCSAPLLAFAGLWGVAWLMQVKGLSRPEAAGVASALLIGWAVGGPLAGAISDRLGRRKPLLQSGILLGVAGLSTLLYSDVDDQLFFYPLFFLTGAGLSAMVVTYALARGINRPQVTGTVLGFVNGMTVAQGAIFQPLLGWLLDLKWDGTMLAGARVYSPEAYQFAFSVLVGFAVLGFCLTLMIREPREPA